MTRLASLATRFRRPVLIVSGDTHEYRVDAGVPWFSLYGVTPVPNITQVIVDRSIEATTDASPIDYLRLKIDPRRLQCSAGSRSNVPSNPTAAQAATGPSR